MARYETKRNVLGKSSWSLSVFGQWYPASDNVGLL